jgi:hypothetical protein
MPPRLLPPSQERHSAAFGSYGTTTLVPWPRRSPSSSISRDRRLPNRLFKAASFRRVSPGRPSRRPAGAEPLPALPPRAAGRASPACRRQVRGDLLGFGDVGVGVGVEDPGNPVEVVVLVPFSARRMPGTCGNHGCRQTEPGRRWAAEEGRAVTGCAMSGGPAQRLRADRCPSA